MREEFYKQVMETLAECGDVKAAIFQLQREHERGFEVGDSDGKGNVIIGFVPDGDYCGLEQEATIQEKVNLALWFNDNDACRSALIDMCSDGVDMNEHLDLTESEENEILINFLVD